MSNFLQFVGSPLTSPPKVIVNLWSSGGVAPAYLSCLTSQTGYTRASLSGVLTAATYKEIIAVTGAGVLEVAFISAVDATSRTYGIKVILDGVAAFDASCAVTTNGAEYGMIAVGNSQAAPSYVTYVIQHRDYVFNASLSLQVKSSLTETDKIKLWYQYRTI